MMTPGEMDNFHCRCTKQCQACFCQVVCKRQSHAVLALSGTYVSTLDVLDWGGITALPYAYNSVRHGTVALLLDEFGAVSASKGIADEKLPIDLLWESNTDNEIVEYTESVSASHIL